MAEINAGMIRELRERTQAGMTDCKSALVEAGGDMEKAVEVILKKGIVKAAARAGKVATEGEVRALVGEGGKRGVIVEVNTQTDFVARGDAFKDFVTHVATVAAKLDKGADLAGHKYPGTDKSIDQVRQELTSKTGENTVVRRWANLEAKEANGLVHAYIHMGGKLAVILHAEAPNADAVKNPAFTAFVDNCAMQIAAMNPVAVDSDSVPAETVERERAIVTEQISADPKMAGKPADMIAKIAEGKLNAFFKESTLLNQAFVKDNSKSVGDYLKSAGGDLKVTEFKRIALG